MPGSPAPELGFSRYIGSIGFSGGVGGEKEDEGEVELRSRAALALSTRRQRANRTLCELTIIPPSWPAGIPKFSSPLCPARRAREPSAQRAYLKPPPHASNKIRRPTHERAAARWRK